MVVPKKTCQFLQKDVSEKYLGVMMNNLLDQGFIVKARLQNKCKSYTCDETFKQKDI